MLDLTLMDINTANAIVAARQESIAQMLQASRQRSKLWPVIGLMLIRAGERLRQDVDTLPARIQAPCPPGPRTSAP